MSKYNCPNCGAPIGVSSKCEYCGTVLKWVPLTTVEFVPANLHVRQAAVETRIPFDYVDHVSKTDVLRNLTQKLSEYIVENKAFDLYTYKDLQDLSCVVRMRTFVGVER